MNTGDAQIARTGDEHWRERIFALKCKYVLQAMNTGDASIHDRGMNTGDKQHKNNCEKGKINLHVLQAMNTGDKHYSTFTGDEYWLQLLL